MVKMSKSAFIIFSSLFIGFFYNLFILPIRLETNKSLGFLSSLLNIFSELLLVCFLIALILMIISFSKYLLKFFVVFFLIGCSVFSYITFTYHVFIEETLIGTFFETDINEVRAVFSIWVVLHVMILGILPSILVIRYLDIKRYRDNFSQNIFMMVILCCFAYWHCVFN